MIDEAREHLAPQIGIAYDPPLSDPPPPDLKLGFDQRHHLPALSQEQKRRRQHEPERNEGDVDHRQIARLRQERRRGRPDVHTIETYHARVALKLPGQLPVADVDGVDPGRPPLKQAVGEPPGRSADIDGDQPLHRDLEPFERPRELEPPATDVRQPALDLDRRRRVDGGTGLVHALPRHLHAPAEHQSPSLLAAGGEPALDEDEVQPPRGFHRELPDPVQAAGSCRCGPSIQLDHSLSRR